MKVLLIDIETERAEELGQLLNTVGADTVSLQGNRNDIYTIIAETNPELVVVDVDSPTRDTLEHVAALQSTTLQPVLMMTKQDNAGVRRLAADIGISLYVVDALSPELVQSLIDVTITHFRSFETLKQEINSLQQTLEERRQVEMAKCLLMETYSLPEAKAYDLLRKHAMQQRLSIAEAAAGLLAKAEADTEKRA